MAGFADNSKAASIALQDSMAGIRSLITTRIETNLKKSTSISSEEAQKICSNLAIADIAPSTWRAICRHDGVFRNYRGREFDWNDDFSTLFIKPIAMPWKAVFIARS
jgi:hypothetical protein